MFSEKQKNEILSILKGKKAARIMIQVPEGLKTGSQDLIEFLNDNNIESLLSVEPCFGACDIRDTEAKMLGCDTLLHIGHKDFGVKARIPVIYYHYQIGYDFVPFVKKIIKNLKSKKICLITTIQFIESLGDVKDFLEKNGIKTYIGGEILGCEATNGKKYENMVDEFLFIGSGRFHPLGLQGIVNKPVLFLDIENNTMENMWFEKSKIDVKRVMRIQKAMEKTNFAIFVSTKPGQSHLKTGIMIKSKLENIGKNTTIIIANQLTPGKILGLKIDVIVNTACPRITEDGKLFGKIIINPEDVNKL